MAKPPILSDNEFHAWNPGLSSNLPKRLLPMITLFRPENSHIVYKQAKEAADFSGLGVEHLCELKVSRLVTHEVLIRVTADLSVPDGPSYEYLGLQLRGMANCIYRNYMLPKMTTIETGFAAIRQRAEDKIILLVDEIFAFKVPSQKSKKRLFWFLKGKDKSVQTTTAPPELLALNQMRERLADQDAFSAACLTALVSVVSSILGEQGRLVRDRSLIVQLALRVFCNEHGSYEIGQIIDPIFKEAAKAEGYRFLPAQSKPIVMNTKGASAAGKSTIRPQQRLLAERIGIPWGDFALISPDYWRKHLLDYDSLGDDYKYAAMLTGRELECIDKKLDQYMAQKAINKTVPHLLIDRFRFDSFKTDAAGDYKSTLLSRFGSTVFLFFAITPPPATVERAWKRGLTTQRYKAVDDLLYHNIEAFTGIPELFFSWVSITDKDIYFEFLDNDVPLGKLPKTVAFGRNGSMTVLDPIALSNIDRFKEVNISATRPEDVLRLDWTPTYEFLRQCIEELPGLEFANQRGGQIYGKIKKAQWKYKSTAEMPNDKNIANCLSALGWDSLPDNQRAASKYIDMNEVKRLTLGEWGTLARDGK